MYPGYWSVTNHLSSLLEYQLLSMWSLASLGDDIDLPGSQLNLWWFLSCHHPGCPTSFSEDLSLNLYNLLEETICPESPRAGDKPKCFVRCLVWDRLPMTDWWSQEGKLNEPSPKSPHFTPSGGSSCCLRNLQFTRFYIKAHHNSHTFYCFVEANTKRSLNFVALVELLRGSQKDLEG